MIQLNEYHRPNTVYLKGIRRPIKKIYITVLKITQQHSWLEEWHSQIKSGNIRFAPSFFSHVITLQCYVSAELDFYLQLFKKLFKTATHLQNTGNMSKKLRSWQMERKSLMRKGVSSSLLLSLQKVEHILGWIKNSLQDGFS